MDSILEQLPSLEATELETLCGVFGIDPTVANGRKAVLKMLLLKYLSSDDAQGTDEGEAESARMDGEIAKILKAKAKGTGMVAGMGGTGTQNTSTTTPNTSTNPTTPIVTTTKTDDEQKEEDKKKLAFLKGLKLSQFKITGAVGTSEGCIDFRNLNFQIKDGRTQGYGFAEIRAGIIKAIKTGSSMKKYFENAYHISDIDFMNMLRSYYKVQDATTLFNQLVTAAQEPKESEMDFVLRLMDLRNQVITLSDTEGCAFDPDMVRKKFAHALSVGFSNDTIRLELRPTLKNHNISDMELLEEVNVLVQREAEHQKRVRGKEKEVKASVKQVQDNTSGLQVGNVNTGGLEADIRALGEQMSEMMVQNETALNTLRYQIQKLERNKGLDRVKNRQDGQDGQQRDGGGSHGLDGGNRGGGSFRGRGRGGRYGRWNNRQQNNNGNNSNNQTQGTDGRPSRARGNFLRYNSRGQLRGGRQDGGGNRGGQDGGSRDGQDGGQQSYVLKVKCANCERDGLFCMHCTECGEEGHRRAACPLND